MGYSVAAVGDVMLARKVGEHFAAAPQDFLMDGVHRRLSDFDIVCLNLENPVGTKGRPDPVQDPHVTFRACPDTLVVLKRLGVTLVSLGNNHMLDYGEIALIETLEQLDAAGIKWVGAGRNYEEANRPLLITCNGQRIGFLSYAFIYSANSRMAGRHRAGISDHRLRRVLCRVRELARSGCEVIVLIHWGQEYSFYPLPYQMRQARLMIDHGASLVLGHGPHYPQGIEEYRGGQIVYSLGNFIFDEPHKFANRSFIYGAELDGSRHVRRSEIIPVHLNHHVPAIVDGEKKKRTVRLVEALTTAYPRKSRRFWKRVNEAYLTDVCGRVIRTRSLKYLFVPHWSFYRDIGLLGIVRKLKLASLMSLVRSLTSRTLLQAKHAARSYVPLSFRLPLAIWLDRQRWLGRDHIAVGLLRDLRAQDPKAFHKLLWSHHFMGYARWYDCEDELFDMDQMQPSRRELFKELISVLPELDLAPSVINSILEVGCSLGYLLRYLETDVFPGCQDIAGIDIDASAIAKGKAYLEQIGSRVTLSEGDMEQLDKIYGSRSFDVIIAAGVLSYLDEVDAARVVSMLLSRTNKVLALAGLACTTRHNHQLDRSETSPHHDAQWLHNFERMVLSAGGRIIKSRWEGEKLYNLQTIYFVFAAPQ